MWSGLVRGQSVREEGVRLEKKDDKCLVAYAGKGKSGLAAARKRALWGGQGAIGESMGFALGEGKKEKTRLEDEWLALASELALVGREAAREPEPARTRLVRVWGGGGGPETRRRIRLRMSPKNRLGARGT